MTTTTSSVSQKDCSDNQVAEETTEAKPVVN